MLSFFLLFPAGALLMGVAFALLARSRRQRAPAVAAALWGIYGVYESLMHARILCSGECNIRVDLLLIYPLLLVVSVIGFVAALRGSRPRN